MTALLWRRALLDYARRPLNLVLLVVVPVVIVVALAGDLANMSKLLSATAKPGHLEVATAGWAAAAVAGLAGFFQVVGSRDAEVTGSANGDRRLALAGFRLRHILAGHLGVIAAVAVITSAVSLAVSAAFFTPRLWVEYAGAVLLIAFTYAMIGVVLGPLVGRLGGLYLLLLLSIVDVGYGQTVMFHPTPPAWGAFLPARGASRLLLDGAFSTSFEQYAHLLLGLGWLAGLGTATVVVFGRQTGNKRTHTTTVCVPQADCLVRGVVATPVPGHDPERGAERVGFPRTQNSLITPSHHGPIRAEKDVRTKEVAT
jgi:hypothetical protein